MSESVREWHEKREGNGKSPPKLKIARKKGIGKKSESGKRKTKGRKRLKNGLVKKGWLKKE